VAEKANPSWHWDLNSHNFRGPVAQKANPSANWDLNLALFGATVAEQSKSQLALGFEFAYF
jgi:hypothetical protein